jgi:hypothetical protein
MVAPTDPAKVRAVLDQLEAEDARRLAEKIAADEVVAVPLYIVAGSHAEARIRVEQAKAAKLAELHAAGDQREVVFRVDTVVTGVLQAGEVPDPASVPSAPGFSSPEDAPVKPSLPVAHKCVPDEVVEDEVVPEDDPSPVEFYVFVTVRNPDPDDDDGSDAGEIREGWYSVEDGEVVVTDGKHKHIGSRRLGRDEDPKALARVLLREKTPQSEAFNRRLSYPASGLA